MLFFMFLSCIPIMVIVFQVKSLIDTILLNLQQSPAFKKLDFRKLRSDFSNKNAMLLETQQAVFRKVSYITGDNTLFGAFSLVLSA